MRLRETIALDWSQRCGARTAFLVIAFRITQAARGVGERPRLLAWPAMAVYRAISLASGIDLPVRTRVGAGLTICHGFGITIDRDARIGSRCLLRQGVTVGVRKDRVAVLGDDVHVNSGAQVLGATVGDRAVVGAGAIVIHDVPADVTVVGNPARIVGPRGATL